MSLVGASGHSGDPVLSSDLKQVLERRPALRTVWSWVLLVDFATRVWSRHLGLRVNGGVHIFDRHTLDAVIDLEAVYRFAAPSWSLALIPSPHVRILVEAPPDEAGVNVLAADLYRRYRGTADAVVAGRRPVSSLVEEVAPAVLARYFAPDGSGAVGHPPSAVPPRRAASANL